MNFEDALVAAQRGRALVILGAGFSLDAEVAPKKVLPTGKQLADDLLAELGSTESLDYGLAADLYSRSLGEDGLRTFLCNRLRVSRTSASQDIICAAPWRRIYTTNFDDVVEVSRNQNGLSTLSVTPREDPASLPKNNSWCVHLHGFISESTDRSKPFPFILTRTSYIDPALQRTKWPTQLQLDIEAADAIFVIGYSIADFHIARLLRTSSSSVRKTYIILESTPSTALAGYVSQFGQVSAIGTNEFAIRLNAAILELPADEPEPTLVCFEEIFFPSTATRPTTEAMLGLLSLGTIDDSVLSYDILNSGPHPTPSREITL